MKTPEQLAEEYAKSLDWDDYVVQEAKAGFLAGYQAAKDTYKDAISTYEEVAKQMLEEAVRIMSPKDQLADAGKVMNFSNNSNGWISVKERLPEDGQEVLVFDEGAISVKSLSSYTHKWHPYENGFDCEPSHWLPLPKPPEDKYQFTGKTVPIFQKPEEK